jgi:hypothetical protein
MTYDVTPIIQNVDRATIDKHLLDTNHTHFLEYAKTDNGYIALHTNGAAQ